MKKFLTILLAGATLALTGVVLTGCGGSNNGGCTSNTDCASDEYCDLTSKTCKPKTACNQVEKCADLCCGDPCDTGTECPDTCGAGQTCNTTSCVCEACQPDCVDKDCGGDGCGGSCGSCTGTDTCDNSGKCVPCQADCTGKVCGDDGCGGSCGTCNTGEHCDNGACVTGGMPPGDPCPNGDADCPTEWPTCLSGGGTTYCSKACTTDTDCGDPNCCLDAGGSNFCFDYTQCPGNSDVGDPCPFDTVNTDADACKEGLTCLGIAASGTSGTCTTDDDCSSLGEEINPDCVSGNCGASFCAEECPGGVAADCPAGTIGQDISGTCYCVPKPNDECTDPINNIGCGAGEKCVVYSGALVCATEGTGERLDACDSSNPCKAGMECLGWNGGDYFCQEFCNGTDETGCTGPCDVCIPDQDLPDWGECLPMDCCDMTEDDTVQCGTNFNGNPTFCSMSNPPDDCSTACWETGGGAEDSTCTWDDCGPNLFCTFYLTDMGDSDSGTCVPRCDTAGSDCTSPDTCGHIDAITGCDGSWGICGQ